MTETTYFPPPESRGGWRALVPANQAPTAEQKRAVLETAGLDWDALHDAWNFCTHFDGPNTLLVVRHGWSAAEWFNFTDPQGIASCTKSLTGLAMMKIFDLSDENRLPRKVTPDDPAWRYLPAQWGETESKRKHITLRHLLTMTSGLDPLDSDFDERYYQRALGRALEAQPGSLWAYSSGPVDLLSLVVENVSGRTLAEFFNQEIGFPIGAADTQWGMFGMHAGGSGGPGGGARFTPRDLARVGHLVLHDGRWEAGGRPFQVLNAARLREMTRHAPFLDETALRSPNFAFEPDANRFYGHLWWTNCTGQALGEGAPRDTVYMSGWGKQACFVVPSLDMVVVHLGRNVALNAQPEFYHGLWERIGKAIARP